MGSTLMVRERCPSKGCASRTGFEVASGGHHRDAGRLRRRNAGRDQPVPLPFSATGAVARV